MNPCSATKCATTEERRKAPMNLPMRVHELLGLPRSADKLIERPRPQPIRVKYLLDPTRSCDRPPAAYSGRATLGAASASKVRRKLYNDTAAQTLVDNTDAKNTMEEIVGGRGNPKPIRILGLSKSDGKAQSNHPRSRPVRVKQLESWEKSQTTKAAAPKFRPGGPGTSNVRRKLYSVVPSPVPPRRVVKITVTTKKTKEHVVPSDEPQKIVEPNVEKSAKTEARQKTTRKSCLLPPNSIRDKYISRQVNEMIVEESPSVINPEIQNILNPGQSLKDKNVESGNVTKNEEIKTVIEAKSSSSVVENSELVDPGALRNFEDDHQDRVEVPRPTVIIGLATSTATKNSKIPMVNISDSNFSSSRLPLRELNINSSTLQNRIDQTDAFPNDLPEDSPAAHEDNQLFGNLPRTSFLNNCSNNEKVFAQMDGQTLSWLRGNLKLCIQTTEESLFSMKHMLETIENIVENNSKPEVVPSNKIVDVSDSTEIPKIFIRDFDENVKNFDDDVFAGVSPLVNDDEIIEENIGTNRNDIVSQNLEDNDKENRGESERVEKNVRGEEPRRRSARLAGRSPKNSDDSFLLKELELNITHVKSRSGTPKKNTPAKRGNLDIRNRKSIREYMALKSSIAFLQTPEPKGLPTPKSDKKGTPAERRAVERALSRRLLNQLNDLYDDSPD